MASKHGAGLVTAETVDEARNLDATGERHQASKPNAETLQAASAPPLGAASFDWRALLAVHPAADLFPLLPDSELQELASDIEANGLRTPIILWAPQLGAGVA